MRLVDATPLECQAKERKENEWNQRVSPTSWAHAEESFLHRIEDAPTVDAVIVTRCEDCVHWDDDPDTYGTDYGPKGKCMKSFETMCADDFCSYGERKENDHEKV